MSTNILIRTKLYKPQIPANLVDRPWLLEWPSQHRRRPLTLVSASDGYGKTTLISSWLESVESPSAWLSLDEYDDNLTGFLTYFIAAVQTIFPESGRETQDLLEDAHSGVQAARRGGFFCVGINRHGHPEYL
jgi:LuxR family maltose regulon positive regulatory protein